MLSEEKLKKKKYWYNIFSLKYILWIWIYNNCISKLSIKMFIKKKQTTGKAYAHQMLVSFKRSVT